MPIYGVGCLFSYTFHHFGIAQRAKIDNHGLTPLSKSLYPQLRFGPPLPPPPPLPLTNLYLLTYLFSSMRQVTINTTRA